MLLCFVFMTGAAIFYIGSPTLQSRSPRLANRFSVYSNFEDKCSVQSQSKLFVSTSLTAAVLVMPMMIMKSLISLLSFVAIKSVMLRLLNDMRWWLQGLNEPVKSKSCKCNHCFARKYAILRFIKIRQDTVSQDFLLCFLLQKTFPGPYRQYLKRSRILSNIRGAIRIFKRLLRVFITAESNIWNSIDEAINLSMY